MAKLPEKVVEEVIVAQTTDPLKTKGRGEKKGNSFFWEAYVTRPAGKRSTMAKWAKELRQSQDTILAFDKNGNIESRTYVQRVKTVKTEKIVKRGKN